MTRIICVPCLCLLSMFFLLLVTMAHPKAKALDVSKIERKV